MESIQPVLSPSSSEQQQQQQKTESYNNLLSGALCDNLCCTMNLDIDTIMKLIKPASFESMQMEESANPKVEEHVDVKFESPDNNQTENEPTVEARRKQPQKSMGQRRTNTFIRTDTRRGSVEAAVRRMQKSASVESVDNEIFQMNELDEQLTEETDEIEGKEERKKKEDGEKQNQKQRDRDLLNFERVLSNIDSFGDEDELHQNEANAFKQFSNGRENNNINNNNNKGQSFNKQVNLNSPPAPPGSPTITNNHIPMRFKKPIVQINNKIPSSSSVSKSSAPVMVNNGKEKASKVKDVHNKDMNEKLKQFSHNNNTNNNSNQQKQMHKSIDHNPNEKDEKPQQTLLSHVNNMIKNNEANKNKPTAKSQQLTTTTAMISSKNLNTMNDVNNIDSNKIKFGSTNDWSNYNNNSNNDLIHADQCIDATQRPTYNIPPSPFQLSAQYHPSNRPPSGPPPRGGVGPSSFHNQFHPPSLRHPPPSNNDNIPPNTFTIQNRPESYNPYHGGMNNSFNNVYGNVYGGPFAPPINFASHQPAHPPKGPPHNQHPQPKSSGMPIMKSTHSKSGTEMFPSFSMNNKNPTNMSGNENSKDTNSFATFPPLPPPLPPSGLNGNSEATWLPPPPGPGPPPSRAPPPSFRNGLPNVSVDMGSGLSASSSSSWLNLNSERDRAGAGFGGRGDTL